MGNDSSFKHLVVFLNDIVINHIKFYTQIWYEKLKND